MNSTQGPGDEEFELRPGASPLPGYRLVARLGSGGFGEVWKVEAPGGFEVAFKFVAMAGAAVIESRSLNLLKKIRHPNLLTPFGTWELGRWLVIGMELADGSLWDHYEKLARQGLPGIPFGPMLDFMTEAARGIDHLNGSTHELEAEEDGLSVQHRDLKPQNILLVGGGVKVADFGLARLLGHSCTGHSGSMTIAYAAPEFFECKTSSSSDQYSLAVTYCALRTGQLPFRGSHAEIMAGHLHHSPDLSMLPEVERPAIARALAKQPKGRWPSCRDLVEALRAAGTSPEGSRVSSGLHASTADRRDVAAGGAPGSAALTPRGARWSRRRLKLTVCALLGAGLLAAVIVPLGSAVRKGYVANRSAVGETGPAVKNNGWYRYNPRSNTVLVFVHGIFSDSRTAWSHEDAHDPKSSRYWPELVASDERFEGASTYLAGYETALDSGEFGVRECAEQLARNLEVPDTTYKRAVMQEENIIFVCHSTGGIIARYLLMDKAALFKGKKVGLVLIASPSLGTDYADYLGWLAEFYHNRLALQIKRDDPVLADIDSRFKSFVYTQKTFELVGAEAWESKFPLHSRWFPDQRKIVDRFSAARYFDSGSPIANTDHFSIVRPGSVDSDSHVFLVRFYDQTFKRHERSAGENEDSYEKIEQTLRKTARLFAAVKVEIRRDPKPGAVSQFVVNSELSAQDRAILDQSVDDLRKLIGKVNPPVVERQRVLHDVTNAVIALWNGDGKTANVFLSRDSVSTYIANLNADIGLGTSIMTYKALVAESLEDWPTAIRNYQIVLDLEGSDSQRETWRRLFLCKLNYIYKLTKEDKIDAASELAMEAETLILKNSKNRAGTELGFDGQIGLNGVPKPWEFANYTGKSRVEIVPSETGSPALRLITDRSSSAVFRPCLIDPKETPILSWEWRTDVFPEKGDLRYDRTDDQACQVVLNFVYDRKFCLFQYAWDTNAPVGTTHRRKILGGLLSYTMLSLVIRSGQADKGKWVRETRNLADDLRTVLTAETEAGIPPATEIKFRGIALQGNTQYTMAASDGSFRSIHILPSEIGAAKTAINERGDH